MTIDTPDQTPDQTPERKQKLLERARLLNLVQLQTQKQREENQKVIDWIETQPPPILDISIGK